MNDALVGYYSMFKDSSKQCLDRIILLETCTLVLLSHSQFQSPQILGKNINKVKKNLMHLLNDNLKIQSTNWLHWAFRSCNQAWLKVQDDWPCIGELKWQGHEERDEGEKAGRKVCMHVHLTVLEVVLYVLPSLTAAHSSSPIHQLD